MICGRSYFGAIGALTMLIGGRGVLADDATSAPATSASAATTPATTESASTQEGPKLSIEPVYPPDSVDENLLEVEKPHAGIFEYGPVSLIDPGVKYVNKSLESIGLRVGLAYTTVFQAATNGPGTRTAAGQDLDFFGDWRLLGKKDDPIVGLLYFSTEWRGDMGTGIAPGALGGQVGSLWGTTNGFGEQPYTVKELFWEQRFATDRVIFRLGKLDPENYYNSNYWQSDNKYFLNAAFSSFPVRAFPGQGLGLNVTAKMTDDWYVSTGAQDAQGKKTLTGFDTLFQDFNLFGAFEVGYTPTIANLGRGNYRFTGWYRDAGESNGKAHDGGFDLSFDQHVGPNLVPFFRYGVGEGNLNGIQQMVSGGIGWEGKLLTASDAVGVGASWGQPSNRALRDQFVAEVFYRLQVSPDNQLTVGYQVIVDPSNNPGSDVVGVLGIRWRISF